MTCVISLVQVLPFLTQLGFGPPACHVHYYETIRGATEE